MKDYYKTLELKRDCTDTQIKQAYRKFALKWHPEKNSGKKREISEQNFAEISEAYEVLSDPQRRARYDQFGEAGLKAGVPNGKGGFVPGWSFSRNPEQIFAEFFGTNSPFADFGSNATLSVATPAPAEKQLPLELNLYCSLEELYTGCAKKAKVARRRLTSDGKSSRTEDAVLTVDVKQGWKAGTKITFQAEGHEGVGLEPSDLVFTLREKPHPLFTRRENDLVYRAPITLLQALTGTTIDVHTLDGRTLPIAIHQIVQPGSSEVVPNEGMPHPRDPKQRGNLIIEFDISFPKVLTPQQKQSITKILNK